MKFRVLSGYLCVLFIVTLCLRILLIGYFDCNLGGIEPNVIYGIQRVLSGQLLYQDPQYGTFAVIQYTPLWYYAVAGIARLISADSYGHGLDVHGLYVLSRTLALICNITTVFVLAAIMRASQVSWRKCIFLSLPAFIILTAHYYTRGDSLHLLLFSVSIWLYMCYLRGNSPFLLILCAFASALCITTKQSGALACGIIALSLSIIERKPLTAIYYSAVTVFSVALVIWCVAGSNWLPFFQNTVMGLANGVDTSFLWRIFVSRYYLDMVPCYLLGAIMLVWRWKQNGDKISRSLMVGMASSWLFAVVSGLKIGSSNNYFSEFLLLLFAAVPYFIEGANARQGILSFGRREISWRFVTIATVVVITTSRAAGLFTAVCLDKSVKNERGEYASEQQLLRYFTDSLHIRKGEHIFFTERRFLDNIFVNYSVMPTKDIVTQIFNANPSTFNYNRFTNGMNSGLIKYIVTSVTRDDINICNDSLPFIVFDKRKFRRVAQIRGFTIYAWLPG